MKRLWAPWRMEYILEAKDDTSGACIFCDIPGENNDRQNLVVHRAKNCFVMLNKYPYNNGHLMVIPYKHESDHINLDDATMLEMMKSTNLAIMAVRNTMNPHGINIGINLGRTAGAGIDEHLHYHLVPRWDGDTNFMPVLAQTKVVSEALEETRQKLHDEFNKLTKDI